MAISLLIKSRCKSKKLIVTKGANCPQWEVWSVLCQVSSLSKLLYSGVIREKVRVIRIRIRARKMLRKKISIRPVSTYPRTSFT